MQGNKEGFNKAIIGCRCKTFKEKNRNRQRSCCNHRNFWAKPSTDKALSVDFVQDPPPGLFYKLSSKFLLAKILSGAQRHDKLWTNQRRLPEEEQERKRFRWQRRIGADNVRPRFRREDIYCWLSRPCNFKELLFWAFLSFFATFGVFKLQSF